VDGEFERQTIIPHAAFDAPDCCGCLKVIINGVTADLVCNECGALIRSVQASEIEETLREMELTLSLSSAICPHCGAVNLFPGLSLVVAFVCHQCGEPVTHLDQS
jgi:hypothetical protein